MTTLAAAEKNVVVNEYRVATNYPELKATVRVHGPAGAARGSATVRAAVQPNPLASVPKWVRESFDMHDADRSGGIEQGELRRALGSMGYDTSTGEAVQVLRKYDPDKNGRLDLIEFHQLVQDLEKHQKRRAALELEEEAARRAAAEQAALQRLDPRPQARGAAAPRVEDLAPDQPRIAMMAAPRVESLDYGAARRVDDLRPAPRIAGAAAPRVDDLAPPMPRAAPRRVDDLRPALGAAAPRLDDLRR